MKYITEVINFCEEQGLNPTLQELKNLHDQYCEYLFDMWIEQQSSRLN